MNTDHIMWVGKLLDRQNELPCCWPTWLEELAYIIWMPSRQSYAQLVDYLPCFLPPNPTEDPLPSRKNCFAVKENYDRWHAASSLTSQQQGALSAFRNLHAEVCARPTETVATLTDLEAFVVCFDAFFYEGWVAPRCFLQWYAAKEKPKTHSAEAAQWHICNEHKQCHTMCIWLTPPKPCPDPRLRRERLDELLSLLLHELCHAYICIFADWRDRTLEDALTENGPAAHGLAFENIMKMCSWGAADYFGLEVDALHVEGAAEAEGEVVWKTMQLRDWIEFTQPSEGALVRRMVTDLKVSVEQAGKYSLLRERGFDCLEAITMVWGADLVLWLKPEMRARVPGGWVYTPSALPDPAWIGP